MEIECKCKWCEVEMPESELNSERLCDRCDRAIESKEGKKED